MNYEEWNLLLKKIKFTSKNSAMFEKENVYVGRSLESGSQNHSMHEMATDKGVKKDFIQVKVEKSENPNENFLYNKLKT